MLLGGLSLCTGWWNHRCDGGPEHFCPPRRNPCSWAAGSPFFPPAQLTPAHFLSPQTFFLWIFHINGTIQHVAFGDRVSQRGSARHVQRPSVPQREAVFQYFSLCYDQIIFHKRHIYLATHQWHLSCFHFAAITNNTATNMQHFVSFNPKWYLPTWSLKWFVKFWSGWFLPVLKNHIHMYKDEGYSHQEMGALSHFKEA